MRRNTLLEMTMGALMGALLIVAPAARAQSGSTETQTPQPPSTQLPQDQNKDQQGSIKGDRATPQSSGDEDRMGLKPPNDKDNMGVQPQSDRDSSADPMAVRPQDRD